MYVEIYGMYYMYIYMYMYVTHHSWKLPFFEQNAYVLLWFCLFFEKGCSGLFKWARS